MGANGMLIFLVILGICTIAIFNVCGVNVTKHISALARSIADVSRTLIVWIVSLIVTFSYGEPNKLPNYTWENTRVAAIMVELVGFLVLVFGNFVYNEIVVLPFAKPVKEPTEEERNQHLLPDKDVSLHGYTQETDNYYGGNSNNNNNNTNQEYN
jgi:hypothetical protein